MVVQAINDSSLAIYLDKDEIANRAAQIADINEAQALFIIQTALSELGYPNWENYCLEIFPGRDSFLLFATAYSGKPYFYVFENIEILICASKVCPPGLISSVTYYNEKYILTVYTYNNDVPPGVLSEYGMPLDAPAEYAFHLEEHGKSIACNHALNLFRERF